MAAQIPNLQELYVYLSWTVLGLCYCLGFLLVAMSRGFSLVVLQRLLLLVASLVVQNGL